MAITDWFILIYIPIAGLYGDIRLQIDANPLNTLRSPFLGLSKKLSLKTGALIWMVQLISLGVVLMQFAISYCSGESPFIRMW